jgi:NlpC/P60 family putative phage cell wall peptidase
MSAITTIGTVILDSLEAAQRKAVVEEARKWLRTPFHNHACLRGVGCDCLGLLLGVYMAVGVVSGVDVPKYAAQWMLHKTDELYLAGMEKYCREVATPQMGDIALFRFGKTYSHSGIVVHWPTEMIHSYVGHGVEYVNPSIDGALRRRCAGAKFFDPWKGEI